MYYSLAEAVTILRRSSSQKITSISNATNWGEGGAGTFYYKERTRFL